MEDFLSKTVSMITGDGMTPGAFFVSSGGVRLAILLLAAFGIHQIALRIVLPIIHTFTGKAESTAGGIAFRWKLVRRTFHFIPATVISVGLPMVFDRESNAFILLSKALNLYYVLIGLAVYDALLNTIHDVYEKHGKSKRVGLTGTIQALKVAGLLVAIVLALSFLAGRSPVYFLSGLGAFTAIIMLIFKDPILGWVAGIQLSTMDLVRKGDWIDIPNHRADGHVIDINLTTVRVQNWDRTITTIPAYELVSSSFKNWRGMFEGGGRRIKRSMRFDAKSIRFLCEDDYKRLRKIKLLEQYFETKLSAIEEFNATKYADCDMSCPVNGRRLTNIGTFRAYCDAYLRSYAGINQNLIMMTRLMEPTELGVPMEIYAFTNDVMWVAHEGVQSDIFDHLMAIVPEFGLVIYQR
jgi:miniconductance mechanosensitive channel